MFCECGTGSFKHVDKDPAGDMGGGSDGSPKGRKKHGGKVNLYAERGLDRFSMVLSELESRRAKILRHVGSDTGVVIIRFVHVQSKGGWAPVVVKLPEEPFKGASAKKLMTASSAAPMPMRLAASHSTKAPADQASPWEGAKINATVGVEVAPPARRASFSWGRMRRPSCYWPAIIVLTLVSLAVFGRVFAICLTCIWWYLLPTLGSDSSDGAGQRVTQKKKHASPPLHAGVQEVVSSPGSHEKGKRG